MREYSIKLDVRKDDNNIEDIWFIQGDIGGKISLSLLDNGNPIDLTDITIYGFFENKEKVVSEKTLRIINELEGLAEVDITSSILSVPGKIKVEIKLYKGEEIKTTFIPFNILSKRAIDTDETIIGSDEIDVIQVMEDSNKKITQLTEDLKHTIEDVDNKILSLDKEMSDKILDLDSAVMNNINNLVEDVNETVIELQDGVRDSIDQLSINVGNAVNEVNRELEETVDNINKVLEDTVNDVNSNLEILDNAKVDVIVSETKPDIVGLRIGTIWIRPKIEDSEND